MSELPSQSTTFLQSSAPFDTLSEEELFAIANRFNVFYLTEENKQECLEGKDGALFLVQSGQFEIRESSNAVRYVSAGDYFGYTSALEDTIVSVDVNVDAPGLIYFLTLQHFSECLDDQPKIHAFFRSLSTQSLQRNAVNDTNSMWLYTRVKDVVGEKLVTAEKNISIHQAAQLMSEKNVSSLMVTHEEALVGIVTDRDIRHRVVTNAVDITSEIHGIMTTKPHSITSTQTLFDALSLMAEKDIHHLPVLQEDSRKPMGMISATDMIRYQRGNILFLLHEIGKTKNLYELSHLAWQLPHYFAKHAHRLGDYDIAGKILAQATDMMTRKLLVFYEQLHGKAPIPFCWIVYGSQAREDQNLGSDQDNALLLAQSPDPIAAEYFAHLGDYVCRGLEKCGIKRCGGNIMASNPDMRASVDQMAQTSERWVESPTKKAIMHFNIFLDARAVAGDTELLTELQNRQALLFTRSIFLAALARHINESNVPLSIFQQFVIAKDQPRKDTIDIKTQAVAIINELVRLYALSAQIRVPGTLKRLEILANKNILNPKDAKNIHDIWLLLNRLRWRHQLKNHVTDNYIRLADLSSLEKHQLKDAFQIIKQSQQAAVMKFAGGLAA